ncbi:MAG: GDSL-type esterase/lipase family protein [Ferruginibacter sp.]
MSTFSYLALGDSYSIGEQVPFAENFPNHLVQILRKKGFAFYAAEIIAKTGFTTDELLHAIENTITLKTYDFVTLLIGVNNQYRGRAVVDFEIELKQLLQKAIQFAGDKPSRVFVVSIPDWGVTPFAEGRDRKKIAEEIDVYNYACEAIAKKYRCNYINITASQREDGNKEIFLVSDGLHPSGKEYLKWAQKLADAFIKQL